MVRPKLVEIGEPIINQFSNNNNHVNVNANNDSLDITLDDIDIDNNDNDVALSGDRQQHQRQRQQQQLQSSALQRAAAAEAAVTSSGNPNYGRGRNNFDHVHRNNQQHRQQHYIVNGEDTPSSYNIHPNRSIDTFGNGSLAGETGIRSTDNGNNDTQNYTSSRRQQQQQQQHEHMTDSDDFMDTMDINDCQNEKYQQYHHNQFSCHQKQYPSSIFSTECIPQQQYKNELQQRRQHIEIGVDTSIHQALPVPVERMDGIEDHSYKGPMIVLDGANIAYAYSQAALLSTSNTTTNHNYRYNKQSSALTSDARGIQIACNYFLSNHSTTGIRICIVLKQSYYANATSYNKSYSNNNNNNSNSTNNDHWKELFDNYIPKNSKQIKLLLAPVHDDDDAYCLSICQQENYRAQYRSKQNGPGWAYILSNDLYRDAIQRQDSNILNTNTVNDDPSSLRYYLNVDVRGSSTSNNKDSIVVGELGSGRISYTFVDMDTIDTYGDPVLDFIPNPRHPLIQWITTTINKTTSTGS